MAQGGAGSVTAMAALDVSHKTIVPMNFLKVVAAVADFRPQRAPLKRRRSASPKS